MGNQHQIFHLHNIVKVYHIKQMHKKWGKGHGDMDIAGSKKFDVSR